MAAKRTDAQWIEIDPSTLTGDAAKHYHAYKAIYKQMKEAREAFEGEMNELADCPAGKRLVFGYNFGKLSVAMVEDDRKAKTKTACAQSLSQYLAAQANR